MQDRPTGKPNNQNQPVNRPLNQQTNRPAPPQPMRYKMNCTQCENTGVVWVDMDNNRKPAHKNSKNVVADWCPRCDGGNK
jgi:hypothetical protein